MALLLGHALFQVVDVLATLLETDVGHDPLLQRDVALHPFDHRLGQRQAHARDGGGAVAAVHDQLADHRVVVRRDAVAVVQVGVHAHARAAGCLEALHRAGAGHEGVRVLGVDAALDRVAGDLDVLLPDRQLLATGDQQLLAHQVDAGDQLGHRMLHLDAGVHLDEVEAAVLEQELEGAGAAVADADAGIDADLADLARAAPA